MKFSYIYPPRPETKIAPTSLDIFEKMFIYIAEPKLNGSSVEIYTDGKDIKIMNRHKEPIICKIDKSELLALHRSDGQMIFCGEYMNKNQKDETDKQWNHKYVIWDIIMYSDKHLLGTTFEDRYRLLKALYPDKPVKKHLHQISENCFRVNCVIRGFKEMFDDISKCDMYEGLVLKCVDGKLENGTTVDNNTRTQIKCRKPTLNYNF